MGGKRIIDRKVFVLFGGTGVGKSHAAWNCTDLEKIYVPQMDTKAIWFNHYEGEPVLLLEEFHPAQCQIWDLLKWMDKYPVQVRGMLAQGFQAQWTHVIITTNVPVSEWYPSAKPEHKAALNRRITHCVEMTLENRAIVNEQVKQFVSNA